MLYTINNSSITSNALDSLLRIIPDGEMILFYEDGVYNAVKGSRDAHKVAQAAAKHAVYAIDADLEARGITAILPEVKVIGYDGFVDLVEEHDLVPWL